MQGIHQWIPSQRPVTWSFNVFFVLRLNKRVSHCIYYNVIVQSCCHDYLLPYGDHKSFHLANHISWSITALSGLTPQMLNLNLISLLATNVQHHKSVGPLIGTVLNINLYVNFQWHEMFLTDKFLWLLKMSVEFSLIKQHSSKWMMKSCKVFHHIKSGFVYTNQILGWWLTVAIEYICFQNHLKIKSEVISFAHYAFLNCLIIWNFCHALHKLSKQLGNWNGCYKLR